MHACMRACVCGGCVYVCGCVWMCVCVHLCLVKVIILALHGCFSVVVLDVFKFYVTSCVGQLSWQGCLSIRMACMAYIIVCITSTHLITLEVCHESFSAMVSAQVCECVCDRMCVCPVQDLLSESMKNCISENVHSWLVENSCNKIILIIITLVWDVSLQENKKVIMPSFVETNSYYYVFIVNWLWHTAFIRNQWW